MVLSEYRDEPQSVFNLEVEGDHEYLVGASALRVHNTCDGIAASTRWKGFRPGSLTTHHGKHGAEFGDVSQSEYLQRARSFASEGGDFLEQQVGNFVVKYDSTTRRTLVGHTRSREIRTFYVADGRDADPFGAAVDLAREISGL